MHSYRVNSELAVVVVYVSVYITGLVSFVSDHTISVVMDPTDLLLHPLSRRKKSLIRRLSHWLPLPKATRIHFQVSITVRY